MNYRGALKRMIETDGTCAAVVSPPSANPFQQQTCGREPAHYGDHCTEPLGWDDDVIEWETGRTPRHSGRGFLIGWVSKPSPWTYDEKLAYLEASGPTYTVNSYHVGAGLAEEEK